MKEYQIDKAEPSASEVSLISQKTRQPLACVPLTALVLLHSPDNRFLSEMSCSTQRAVPYHESHYTTLPRRSFHSARWHRRDHPGICQNCNPEESRELKPNPPPSKVEKASADFGDYPTNVTTKDCDSYTDLNTDTKEEWKQLLYILTSALAAVRLSVGGNPEKSLLPLGSEV